MKYKFKGRQVIHCDSFESAKKFLKEAEEEGVVWASGKKPTDLLLYGWELPKAFCYVVYDNRTMQYSYIFNEKDSPIVRYTAEGDDEN